VFLFGDTYVGRVGAGGTIDPSHIIRNSFVVQSGNCFAPLMGGTPLHRTSLVPEPNANEWYWPASGVVEGGLLRVILWHMATGGSPFQTLDMQVATFSSTLQLLRIDPLPVPTDNVHPYGATVLAAPDGNLYLYGTNQQDAYVARVPLGHLLDTPPQFSFYSGLDASQQPTWSPSASAAVPMHWTGMPQYLLAPSGGGPGIASNGNGPYAQPWVTSSGGTFVATAKLVDGFTDDVSAFQAPTPAGPWTYAPTASPPENPMVSVSTPGLLQYGAYTRFVGVQPMIEYNTNLSPFANPQPPLTIATYGPHFVTPTQFP
jgi:hypothetical protein